MYQRTKIRRGIAVFVAFCLSLSTFIVGGADATDTDSKYPNGKLIFSGFTMQQGADGNVQALLKLTLEHINATGVSFTLGYDSSLLVPSDYSTNADASTALEAFKPNTDDFPSGFYELQLAMSDVDSAASTVHFTVSPNKTSSIADDGPNIGIDTTNVYGQNLKYFKAENTNLDLGYISFKDQDPARLSQMSDSELASTALYVVDNEDASDKDIKIIYIGDDGQEKFVAKIGSEWDVSARLISVDPKYEEKTVSAYTLYYEGGQTGTQSDLIGYLNKYFRTVILRYSDNTYIRDTITWDSPDSNFSVSPVYDPLGGTYTVSQDYNDDFSISMTIRVTPVYLLRFRANKLNKVFPDNARPSTWDDLDMPSEAKPILSESFDTYIPPSVTLARANWLPIDDVTSSLLNDPAFVSQDYTYEVSDDEITTQIAAPWLTTDGANRTIKAVRSVGEQTTAPGTDEISASVERVTGVMTINVDALGGVAIPDDTSFKIYLPNGIVIDTADNDIATVNISNGTAVITIDTSSSTIFTQNELDSIQSVINLGSNNYNLTATEPNKGESEQTRFNCDARVNYYIADVNYPANDGPIDYIEADYSNGRSSMFTVYTGQSLDNISTYIEFPDGTQIPTAYHGISGISGAALGAAKVDSWSIEGSTDTDLPATAGTTVVLVGRLSDYTYTNFGYVQNPDDIYLKIKVTVQDGTYQQEQIRVTTKITQTVDFELIDDSIFNFNMQTLGYTSPQVNTFKVENIGTTNIEGLSVRIESTDFILSSPLTVTSLAAQNGTATFDIRTVVGLPSGEYEANVIISSNTNTDLRHFKIKFKVVDENVYMVRVQSNPYDESWGYACIITENNNEVASRTYVDGSIVKIKARPIDADYRFQKWESDPNGYADALTNQTTDDTVSPPITTADFVIDINNTGLNSNDEILITAVFDESIQAKLRLDDLQDRETDDTVNQLRKPSDNTATVFSSAVLEYKVIVPNESDRNKLWFKPKYINIDENTVTVDVNVNGTTVAAIYDSNDGYYKSSLFDLIEGTNTATVTQSYGNESRTYTITIVRKEPVSVTKVYGNSPYGLIARSSQDDTWKNDAKAYFSANRTYGTYVPDGAGDTTLTHYYTDAWADGTDYDKNEYALFVYEGDTFADPGFTDLKYKDGTAVPPNNVAREITFKKLDSTVGSDLVTDLSTVTDETITVQDNGESCNVTELAAYRIRPGIYKIKYSFTDSDGITATFSRPLIILSRKGDLNADKTVDQTDYTNLYNRFTNNFVKEIIRGNESWHSVYTYRIADVNEDRNANTIDANELNAATVLTEYYVKLPSSTTDTTVPTLSTATAPPEQPVPTQKADLKLEYLGIGDTPAAMETVTKITTDDIGKVVWVGVSVEHGERLGEYFTDNGISTMDIAFDYDPQIMMPCGYNGAAGKAAWLSEIEINNFDSGVQSNDALYWDSGSVAIDADAATMDYAPPDGDPLRESPGDLDYQTAYIPIRANGTGTTYRLQGVTQAANKIYLIRVPFLIKDVPSAGKKAIQLHLGPQTFIFGTGTSGRETYGAWERADKTAAAVNLKNYFEWDELYEPSDAYLTNIQAFTYDPPAADGTVITPTEITLYRDKDLTVSGYDAKSYDYYATVSNEVDEITLRLTPDKTVTVTLAVLTSLNPETTTTPVSVATTGAVDPNDSSITYRDTDPMTMTEVSPDILEDTDGDGIGDKYGFSNIIEIALPDGVTKYTVHVRRYQLPRIELAYGNSPAGLIYRDDVSFPTEDDKATALAKFNSSHSINKKFVTGYIPIIGYESDGVTPIYAQTEKAYTTYAWRRSYSNVNYDLDKYAFFVYQGSKVADPGYAVINELGLEENIAVQTSLTVKRMTAAGLPSYTGNDTTDKVVDLNMIPNSSGLYLFTSKMIRPDVYTINYSCTYQDMSGNILSLTNKRPFIMICKYGDVWMTPSPGVNTLDSRNLTLNSGKINTGNSLFAFRVADVWMTPSPGINTLDSRHLLNYASTIQRENFKFYPDLK